MPEASKGGNQGAGAAGAAGGAAGAAGSSGAGAGGSGGSGGNPGAWLETFPTIKSNAELSARLATYESPEAALTTLATGGWGPDWRESYAKGDKAKLAELQRYQDPGAALEGLFSAKARIREGSLAKPLPPNPNAQELKEYRELHGVPEDPKAYMEKLPDGLVIGEDDLPIFNSLAEKVLHKHNLPPAVAHDIARWYNDFIQEEQAATGEQDGKDRQETEDALRTAWGQDYRANANVMKSYLAGLPQDVSAALQNARDLDGRGIMNNPAVVQWVVGMARELNDVSTVLDHGSGATPLLNIDAELKKIDDFRRQDRKAYNKDEAMQQRERDLIDAKNKLVARNQQAGRAA
jgi:hypothetical protein